MILSNANTPSLREMNSDPPPYEEVKPYRDPTNPRQPSEQTQIMSPDSKENKNHYGQCIDNVGHSPHTKYGTVGIIAGIVFFPWGLFWTQCDSQVTCRKCQVILKPNKCGQKRRERIRVRSGKCGDSC
ncbi:uncharacterized protein IL334_000828 [Kwoniella shivajii]|uniref:Brain protein I3 n=1 Tax=Kwoniella shivajii TaxID=564305 RepID=A0ABZ1CRB6_9TREE|nr:hypothetical protein IL334_000828 [Kwoniella shivajii]